MTERDFELLEKHRIKNKADYPIQLKKMNEKKLELLKEMSMDIIKKLEENNISVDEMQIVLELTKLNYGFLYR
ncbi:hypothetical protein [Fusobacterium sp.]|uniref:hypothetical protein n=1 Tax=Fusobacterium sp. TaxID=68766 RepID=UPI000E8B698F|nr:hypothetical protein [Fusobacterium sp.]HBJ80157.1 hypothetical protein [Fusobacterium sp.]